MSLSGFRLRGQEWIDRRRVQLGKVAVHIGISKNPYPKGKLNSKKQNKTKTRYVPSSKAASRHLKPKYKYKYIQKGEANETDT